MSSNRKGCITADAQAIGEYIHSMLPRDTRKRAGFDDAIKTLELLFHSPYLRSLEDLKRGIEVYKQKM